MDKLRFYLGKSISVVITQRIRMLLNLVLILWFSIGFVWTYMGGAALGATFPSLSL